MDIQLNEKQFKVSVIVAVFNRAETLQKCINSVVAQSYASVELIIIDGNSNDGTVEILEENNLSIDFWLSEPDTGIYNAWNKALKYISGDYICFLGADDYFVNDEVLSELINAIPYGKVPKLICSTINVIDSSGQIISMHGQAWDWKKLKRYCCIAHPGLLHHRTLFLEHGFFNETFKIASDYEFLMRLDPGIYTVYKDMVSVCMNSGGVSNTKPILTLNEGRKIQAAHSESNYFSSWLNFLVLICGLFYRKIRLSVKALNIYKAIVHFKKR